MNDTPPDVGELYRRMLLQRLAEERLGMACRMFSSARALARAGMPATSDAQIRRQMFLRLYADDVLDDRPGERALRVIERWRPR